MRKYISLLILCLSVQFAVGQGLRDVKINEILVSNKASFTDDHSNHSSWIELFNTGYTSVNIAGAHLRLISGSDTTAYLIPSSDIRTIIPPQGYLLFFASGSSNNGTFHTNFELNHPEQSLDGVNDRIEILNQSGDRVLDFIEYDFNTQTPDVSYGRITDPNTNEVNVQALTSITPMQSNDPEASISKAEEFRAEDPNGIAMAAVAMSVVFSALVLLYLIFKSLGYVMQSHARKQESAKNTASSDLTLVSVSDSKDISGEMIAAISMALNSYFKELHDIESEIITINRVARVYSPWSSKIHTLTKLPK